VRADVRGRHGDDFQKFLFRLSPLAAMHGRFAGLKSLAAQSFRIFSLPGQSGNGPKGGKNFRRELQLTILAPRQAT
jgi:hypothetical protein